MKRIQILKQTLLVLLIVILTACSNAPVTSPPEPTAEAISTPLPATESTSAPTQEAESAPTEEPAVPEQAGPSLLQIDFDDGTFGPLVRSFGPTDDPSSSDEAYTVEIADGVARYRAPEREPGIAFTGMLDLPPDLVPIENDLTYQWTFPNVEELLSLGNGRPAPVWAIAACYIRGEMNNWVGGLFGDYWLGYFWSAESGPMSVIRQGRDTLAAEPFTAAQTVSYRLVKSGLRLQLWAQYDDGEWHQVGEDVTITLAEGGSPAVAVTHLRIGDTSGRAIDVSADDFVWQDLGTSAESNQEVNTEAVTNNPAPDTQPVDFTGSEPVRVANARLAEAVDEVRPVIFDLGWDYSWRTSTGASNWDAAWVFAKYRTPDGAWQHASLSTNAADYRVGIDNGIPAAFDPPSDGMGVFVYRAEDGEGSLDWQEVQIPWDIAADKISPETEVEIWVFALAMVYIPAGEFYIGDGTSQGRFFAGGDPSAPYLVTEAPPVFANEPGGLWGDTTQSILPLGAEAPPPWDEPSGSMPEAFPTGYQAFYVMKYELTQGMYAAFLNTLTPQQAERRYLNERDRSILRTDSLFRYTIAPDPINGGYTVAAPTRANNWMNWEDGITFSDWAGLRPLSELEWEKAARGPLEPVPGEYAWGSTYIQTVMEFDGEDGSGAELPLPYESNTLFSLGDEPGNPSIWGPVRVGLHEGKPTRELSGASYYGVMDLSGNVTDLTVTAGNPEGRQFTGEHGNGMVSEQGSADVPLWPHMDVPSAPENWIIGGYGFRGGDLYNVELNLRISARLEATFPGMARLFGVGFRAARTAPGAPDTNAP